MCNLIEIRSTCTHMSSFFAHVVGYHQIFYHPLGHPFHLTFSKQFVNHPLGHTFHLTFSEQFVNHSLICSDYFYKWKSISFSKKEWLRDIEIHVAWVFNLKKKIFKTFWLKKPKHPYKFSYNYIEDSRLFRPWSSVPVRCHSWDSKYYIWICRVYVGSFSWQYIRKFFTCSVMARV